MRHLVSFKPQFAAMVEAGTKRQTIRPIRKRPIKPGDTLILCTGLRTKHYRKIGEAICTEVDDIEIWHGPGYGIWINGDMLIGKNIRAFVRADGFDDESCFYDFFSVQYGGEKFKGVVIHWGKLEVKQ